MLNVIILLGRLTKEPKQINSGENAVVVFDLAVNNPRMNPKDEERGSSFFNCKAFAKTAETIMAYAHKGSQVAIKGQIQQREYLDNGGNKRKDYEVYVDTFQLLDKKLEQTGADNAETEKPVEKPVEEPKFDPYTGKPLKPAKSK